MSQSYDHEPRRKEVMRKPHKGSRKNHRPDPVVPMMAESFWERVGKRLGWGKSETLAVGQEYCLAHPVKGVPTKGVIMAIDGKGRISVQFDNDLIPHLYNDRAALIKDTADQGAAAKYEQSPLVEARIPPHPVPSPRLQLDATMPMGPRELAHFAYTKPVQLEENFYQGHERINSKTKSIQGKVFCPHDLENNMEATVVDYEQDAVLRAYITGTIQPVIAKAVRDGKNLETLLGIISRRIHSDFPYQKKMLNDAYCLVKYPPGKKVNLGEIMKAQDMVCRHMSLLFVAIVNYLLPATEVRFMADQQSKESKKGKRTGHAYSIVRSPESNQKKYIYYVVDPTDNKVIDGEKLLNKSIAKDDRHRYLFSLLRFMCQNWTPEDDYFIKEVCQMAKSDDELNGLLYDLKTTLTDDPEAYMRMYKLEKGN